MARTKHVSPYTFHPENQEFVEEFCSRLASGRHLADVCSDWDMPSEGAVHNWRKKSFYFQESYLRACLIRGLGLQEKILAIVSGVLEPEYVLDEDGELVLGDDDKPMVNMKRIDPQSAAVAINGYDKVIGRMATAVDRYMKLPERGSVSMSLGNVIDEQAVEVNEGDPSVLIDFKEEMKKYKIR